MEYLELIRILLRRWWLILLPVLIAALITIPDLADSMRSSVGGFTAQVRYSAAQKLNLPERDGDYTDIWQASEHTVDALTDWVRSASFRAEIQAQFADEDMALDSLQISADNVRNIGVIYFSHNDREALRALVDAALIVLSSHSQTYFPQLGGESAHVTILDPATVVAAPPALPSRLAPVIRLGIALLIGLTLAFVAEYVDQTIRHSDDLRRMGLTLVGSIPRERT
ncbi:MAG: hypothetical protein OXG78_12925 [Chloroflexi bacterium]|nr:hypothetical protein [Chloroflexota bacterium]